MTTNEHPFEALPVKQLSQLMQTDPEFAWSWQCALAMLAYEAGAPHEASNREAAQFMKTMFDIDVPSHCHEEWNSFEEDWRNIEN